MMTIDAETRLLIKMTQNKVDDAIERFERSYNVIIEDNKAKNTKLDLILSQQAEFAKNIALNKNDIERNKKDINKIGIKFEGMDKELEDVTKKFGTLPLKLASIIIILVTALGFLNKILPETFSVQQSVKKN